MKVIQFFLGLLVVPSLWTCEPKEVGIQIDEKGVAIRLPYFWKTSISNGPRAFGLAHGYLQDGGILCVAMRQSTKPLFAVSGEQYLQCIDAATGKVRWKWDDKLDGQSYFSTYRGVLFYEQTMLFYDSPYQYGIDFITGQTRWKLKRPNPNFGPFATQAGRYFFCGANNMAVTQQDLVEMSVFRGDILTGLVKEVVKPSYSTEFTYSSHEKEIGWVLSTTPVIRGTDTLLVVPHSEFGPVITYLYDNNSRSLFGLYNLTRQQWIYQRIPLSSQETGGTTALPPVIDNDKVYIATAYSIGCFDLMTGKRIWLHRISYASTFSNIMIQEGKLLANCNDAKLYCLDPETGATLWSQKSSAIGSDLYYQDGVVYYIASKNLLAVEVATGKLLWDLPCPDAQEENRPDSWFAGFVTGTPGKGGEKGRIYATTNLNLYCFEAAK